MTTLTQEPKTKPFVFLKADRTRTPFKIIEYNEEKDSYTIESLFNKNLKKPLIHNHIKRYLLDFFTAKENEDILYAVEQVY